MASSLVPHLDKYFENELNVLFIGHHGQGKTYTVKDFAEKNNIKMEYYSASLLDPFTDLAGIPMARRHCDACDDWFAADATTCPECSGPLGGQDLINVRPHRIDRAELLVYDELNRALPKTLNSIFELVQFKTINGELLPNLKCVWAMINPPDSGQYNVEDLDPALVDRFDLYITLNPQPSFEYYRELNFRPDIIRAAIQWYRYIDSERRISDQVKNLISLRRLEKIIRVYELTGDFDKAIPPWMVVDRNRLADLFKRAHDQEKKKNMVFGGEFGKGAFTGIEYDAQWLEDHFVAVCDHLADHPDDIDTNQAIAQTLMPKHGKTLSKAPFLDIFNNMHPSVVEGMIGMMGNTKRETFFAGIQESEDMGIPHGNLVKAKEEFESSFDATDEFEGEDLPF